MVRTANAIILEGNKEILNPLIAVIQDSVKSNISQMIKKEKEKSSVISEEQIGVLLAHIDSLAIPESEAKASLKRRIVSGSSWSFDLLGWTMRPVS